MSKERVMPKVSQPTPPILSQDPAVAIRQLQEYIRKLSQYNERLQVVINEGLRKIAP